MNTTLGVSLALVLDAMSSGGTLMMTTSLDPFQSPIACDKLRVVGVAVLLLFVASILSNAALLWILVSYKDLQVSMNAYVIALTVLNLVGTVLESPFIIISNMVCR